MPGFYNGPKRGCHSPHFFFADDLAALEMRLTQPEYSYKVNLDKAGYQKITGAYSFDSLLQKAFCTDKPDALDTLAVLSA